jgi:hypothetical protein
MLFIAVIAFGVLGSAAVAYLGLRHVPLVIWLAQRGQRTEGTVIDEVVEVGGKGGTRYFPIVIFQDACGGAHQLRSRFSAGRSLGGQKVAVAYDVTRPESRSEVLRWQSIIPELVGALFMLLLAVSLTLGVTWAAFVEYG